MGAGGWLIDTRTSYDAVAVPYAELMRDSLAGYPHLRAALAAFADLGGLLLLGFHVGDRTAVKTEGYGGHPMNVHVHHRPPARVRAWLREAGFTVEAETLSDPDGSRPGAILFARLRDPA